jgi:hypothetical protein
MPAPAELGDACDASDAALALPIDGRKGERAPPLARSPFDRSNTMSRRHRHHFPRPSRGAIAQLCVRTGTPPKFLISVRAFGVKMNRMKSSASGVTVASR